jgi:hypothetical protein
VRAILLSALALGALTSAALAEQPLTLSDDQMDKVTAGRDLDTLFVPGAPFTVFRGDPDAKCCGAFPAEVDGPPGQTGALFVAGAPSFLSPGNPAGR